MPNHPISGEKRKAARKYKRLTQLDLAESLDISNGKKSLETHSRLFAIQFTWSKRPPPGSWRPTLFTSSVKFPGQSGFAE